MLNEYNRLDDFLAIVGQNPALCVQPLTFYTLVAYCNGYMSALSDEFDVKMHANLSDWTSKKNDTPNNWAWQGSVLRLSKNNEQDAMALVIPLLKEFSSQMQSERVS